MREKEKTLVDEEKETDHWIKTFVINNELYEQEQEMRRILLDFLDVLASFDRCFAAIDSTEEVSPKESSWLRSLDAVRLQLLLALQQAGVSFMHCVGQSFDPTRHQAIEVRVISDIEENTIIEEIVRGCEWHGEVLCFAKVVVATSGSGQHSVDSSLNNSKEM
jgi:molecular chaperone GrpE (heat shock protein)